MIDWGMKLNTNKCKTLHYGKGDIKFSYLVKDESNNLENIEEVNYERDLGVIFETILKWTERK